MSRIIRVVECDEAANPRGPSREWWLAFPAVSTARMPDGKCFERPRAPIVVRSLRQVGNHSDWRPNRQYRRRADARARKQGFASASELAGYIAALARKGFA